MSYITHCFVHCLDWQSKHIHEISVLFHVMCEISVSVIRRIITDNAWLSRFCSSAWLPVNVLYKKYYFAG